MKVSITINDADIKAKLQELANKTGNLAPCMKIIGQEYAKMVRRNFDAESNPEGGKWPKLSSVTMMLAIGGKKGFNKKGFLKKTGETRITSKKVLRDTGALYDSIHYTSDATSATIGTTGNIKYGAIHQFGGMAGRNKKVKIPARPYLAMNEGTNKIRLAERDKQTLLTIIEEYISKG